MKILIIEGRNVELIGNIPNDISELEYWYELINLYPNSERIFEWFADHTSSKGVLSVCHKLADVCRIKPKAP